MMASDYLFAIGSIGLSKCGGRKASTLLQAARHNRREIQAEFGANGHIDASRMHLNQTLAGPDSAVGVQALAKSLMAKAGVISGRLRKDHTQAIELLFSLPAGTTIDDTHYFSSCLHWAQRHFGAVNIVSADIHRDEATPHCHVLVLPLVDGRMAGSLLKGRKETSAMRDSFYCDVAKTFGLRKPTGPLSGEARGNAVKAVMQGLQAMNDPVLCSALWANVKSAIERDPAPFMALLGISMANDKPAKKLKTMTQIFTSPGKGPRTVAIEKKRSNTIAMQQVMEKRRSLSCVVIDDQAHVLSTTPALPIFLHSQLKETPRHQFVSTNLISESDVLKGGGAHQDGSNCESYVGPSPEENERSGIFCSSEALQDGQCSQTLARSGAYANSL